MRDMLAIQSLSIALPKVSQNERLVKKEDDVVTQGPRQPRTHHLSIHLQLHSKEKFHVTRPNLPSTRFSNPALAQLMKRS